MSNKGNYTSREGLLVPCNLVLSGQKLYIYLKDEKNTLLIWDLVNSFYEWQGSQLVITKAGEKLECAGEIAKQVSNRHVREPEMKKKFRFTGVHLFFLLVGISIVSLVLVFYFLMVPWIAEKTATLVPVDLEVSLGEKIGNSIVSGAERNDSVDFYASQFVRNLDLDTKYPVKVSIIHSDEINAFALPGGMIFIYTGLLEKMNSYDELVALLGHELTHVTRQHSLKSIFRGAAAGIVIGGMFGDLGGMGTWLISKADEFKQLDYSRELETEADAFGLQVMVNNKVNPQGMLRLLELLKSEAQVTPGLMKYLSTHPETEERIRNISGNPLLKESFTENVRLSRTFNDLQRSLARFK